MPKKAQHFGKTALLGKKHFGKTANVVKRKAIIYAEFEKKFCRKSNKKFAIIKNAFYICNRKTSGNTRSQISEKRRLYCKLLTKN
jgi:hypothetical protein